MDHGRNAVHFWRASLGCSGLRKVQLKGEPVMEIKRKELAAWRGGLKDGKGSNSTESSAPNPVSAPRDSDATGGSGTTSDAVAFPKLDTSDLAALAPLAEL